VKFVTNSGQIKTLQVSRGKSFFILRMRNTTVRCQMADIFNLSELLVNLYILCLCVTLIQVKHHDFPSKLH